MQIVEQDGATTTVQLNRGAVLVVVMVLVAVMFLLVVVFLQWLLRRLNFCPRSIRWI